jgi:PIN domain nuclease of toxin-antitoxin system
MGLPEVILLDTHVVIWVSQESRQITKAARQAMRKARRNGPLLISSLTLYEIAQLAARGRVQVKPSLEAYLREIECLFIVKPVDAAVAIASSTLPPTYPGDPVDRIIGATALVEGIPLVTADERIRRSGCLQTIW